MMRVRLHRSFWLARPRRWDFTRQPDWIASSGELVYGAWWLRIGPIVFEYGVGRGIRREGKPDA